MQFTTAVSVKINSAIEVGVASMRLLLGAEPALVARAVPSRPNTAHNLTSRAFGLDARLDAIRRAGL